MNVNFEGYERSFDAAQRVFSGDIDTADRSELVAAGDPQSTLDLFKESSPNEEGFYPVVIDSELLRSQPALYVGRALLMHNPRLDVLSPVIISVDPKIADRFLISMFDQPYDTSIGFSAGMHWNISVAAQTRVAGFGGHGDTPSGLEQGHFSAAILGAKNHDIANSIILGGDRGTHSEVIDVGVAESMGSSGIIPVKPVTAALPENIRLMAYWHEKIQNDNGPISGDYPDSTRLMLGAGLYAIGEGSLGKVERLVKDATRGAL